MKKYRALFYDLVDSIEALLRTSCKSSFALNYAHLMTTLEDTII